MTIRATLLTLISTVGLGAIVATHQAPPPASDDVERHA